ncbi:MAG: hypothetical protein RL701_1415 [Pseudomonadota bacterium]|jgi:hypothetical protein
MQHVSVSKTPSWKALWLSLATIGAASHAAAQQNPELQAPSVASDNEPAPAGSALAPIEYDATTQTTTVESSRAVEAATPAPGPIYTDEHHVSVDRNEFSFLLGVPIWFTPDRGVVDPGVSFEARFARRFGFIAPELTLGWQINWLDNDKLPNALANYNLTIDTFFISAGARAYVAPHSPITPFISAAFDLAFWHLTGDNSTACGYYYCATTSNYDVGVGVSGRVGLAFAPNPRLQLELGAKVALTFPVGPIKNTEAWVTPFLGFTALM